MRHPPLFTGIAALGVIPAAAGFFAVAGEIGARSSDPVEIRIPADQVFDGTPGSPGAVVFRHTTHLALSENRCGGCHVGLFKILKPSRRTSHAKFESGKSCGACHDGKGAFSAAEACDTCHAGLPENSPPAVAAPARALPAVTAKIAPPKSGTEADEAAAAGSGLRSAPRPANPMPPAAPAPSVASAGPAPKDVTIPKSEDSPAEVVFRHTTHAAAKCAACHPTLFAMKPGTTSWSKEAMVAGGTCGTCHDGEKAFGVEDPEACEQCHASDGGAK